MHSKNEPALHSQQKQENSPSLIQTSIYTIGEVAKMIGSKVRTVRYYDEIGLVKPSSYTEGGHRLYTLDDIRCLEQTTTLRYLNFGIDDIRMIISGDISVDQAIDWQIESLETQVSALANMISILHQAKNYQGDSLRYTYDLVRNNTVNIEQRKKFISEKIETCNILDGIPAEWKSSALYFFNKYIINQEKASAKQISAWNELQELINSPQFITDLKNVEFLFFDTVHEPRLNAATWVRKLEDIQNRLYRAWKKKYSADSRIVQTLVDDMAMLYANSEQLPLAEDFFLYFAKCFQKMKTKPLERCDTLCSIISPQYHQLSKGGLLLYQGIHWRLQYR